MSVDGPNGYEASRTVQPGKSRTLDGLSQGDYVLTAATGNSLKKWTVNQEPEATVTVTCPTESPIGGQSIAAANDPNTTITTTAATTTESKPTTTETTSTATETATTTKSPKRITTTEAPETTTTTETTPHDDRNDHRDPYPDNDYY